MSDRFASELTLGGPLQAALLPPLLALLAEADAHLDDWDGEPVTEYDLREIAADARPVTVYNLESLGWDDLAQFCRAHDLAYRIRSDATAEADAEVLSWSPGQPKPDWALRDLAGRPAIALADLIDWLRTGQDLPALITTLGRCVQDPPGLRLLPDPPPPTEGLVRVTLLLRVGPDEDDLEAEEVQDCVAWAEAMTGASIDNRGLVEQVLRVELT